ncbi:MAG: SDR family NAD(P)-dependent oxidoreductase [Egibacteraceae bacterium]
MTSHMMQRRYGRIIAVSSELAQVARAIWPTTSPPKASSNPSFARSARELGPHGITVNTPGPGPSRSTLSGSWSPTTPPWSTDSLRASASNARPARRHRRRSRLPRLSGGRIRHRTA